MERFSSLFEQQSYKDAWEDFQSSLVKENFICWDYVLLTASNEEQARGYELQIEHRKSLGQLPPKTAFAVIPDRDGQRIGSGGATLSCLKYIFNKEGTFENKRILVIHSGGDSKRVPQYSACGKLFSPVPRLLPNGRRSTLFDEFLIGMSTVPSRIQDGMLVCSGDVLLLFNALQIDFYGASAAALSIKENVATGKNHGVFLKDEKGFVGSFLHKQSEKMLKESGAVDFRGNVDIDTGAIIMNSKILSALYSLIEKEEDYNLFISEKSRISFYADFLYPLASNSTLEQFYKETPEGEFTPELRECRTRLWNVLHEHNMKLVRLSPASFIHFGTTKELLNLMTVEIGKYSFLDWKNTVETNISSDEYAASNSYISRGASVGKGSYIEDCRIHTGSSIGENCVISGITLFGQRVPDDTVLHGLKLKNGKFVVRMYGVCDNPKEKKYFGNDISVPLWDAKLFPVCDTIEEAVTATLSGKKDGELLSLNESFNMADVTAIIPWQENLSEQVKAETILEMIDCKVPVSDVKDLITEPNSHTIKYLIDRANELNIEVLSQFSTKIRIYAYLSKLVSDQKLQDEMASACLSVVCEATLKSIGDGIKFYKDKKFVKDETVVNLPVRVNWGGGWSDTPPYCMENGGTVLNASISLNGQLPIEVTIKKIKENKFILASTDIGSYKEFDDVSSSIQELQNCKNPSDPFALHKAALVACGVIPRQEKVSITDITNSLGGGLYMNTRVINIPKGSGLGTSSILAGACVKAINEAFDHKWCDEELYERVLCMEQLMSTGGGWQDQVGGISRGIKMAISKPGISQEIKCTPLMIDKDVYEELNSRFFVIYTGQRRLARNLLREVITKYICNDKVSLEAHYAIQRLAVLMRFELEKGNIDGFAKLLNEHWLVSQKIDKGSTNTCIDQIFMSIDDLICGKMICGAGGGGFLQVVLKKGVTKEQLDARIKDVFQDSGVEVWDCDFV